MTKFLVIIVLLLFVLALLARHYRRQVHAARYVWRMYKTGQLTNKPPEKQIATTEKLNDTQLVRCAKCGTWTPRKNAFDLRSNAFYCSTNCLEKTIG